MKFDDIWMIKLLKYCYFIFEGFIILYSSLLHGLYCDFDPCLFVFCEIHSAIASAAKFFFEIICVFDVALVRVNEPLSLYGDGLSFLFFYHIHHLDLLLVLALHNEQRSLRPALQGLHNDITVPCQLVVLELPRLLQVEVQVFILNQLGLEVFVRLGLPL